MAWFDGVEWSPGGVAGDDLLSSGRMRPAHRWCSDNPEMLDDATRAALDAGFLPGGPGSPPRD
jgi:hypothetical protein